MHLFVFSNFHITPPAMNLTNNIIAKRENNQSDPSISNMLRHQGGFFLALTQSHLFDCTDHGKITVQQESGA